MPASIYIYNIQENRNTYETKSIGELLGYSSEELQELGSDLFSKIFHPEEYQLISDHHKRVAELGPKQKLTLDYRVRHKNGNWLWMQSVDTPFKRDEDGKVIDILGYAADITEKKEIRKKVGEGRKRPIIVALTANVTIKAKENSLQAGMDDYLTKPIKKDTFKEILLKWFEKKHIHM